MADLEIELNREAVRELLRSPEMMAECSRSAQAAVNTLGDGYELSTYTGKNRVNAQVAAVSPKAIQDNLKNNTILKAIRRGLNG